MRITVAILALVFAGVLNGCAGTGARVTQPYTAAQSDKFRLTLTTPETMKSDESVLKDRIVTQLADSNLLPSINATNSRTLEVNVTNYRMRGAAVRFMVGALAGKDNILSTVTIKETSTGRVLGRYEIESNNPTAWGSSRGMIEAHADKIVAQLKGSTR